MQNQKSKIQNHPSKRNETVGKHVVLVVLSLSLSMPFIGFPITSQNAPKKKLREFPLRGPSPCGKTGLAPCRQCPFFLFFLFFFLTKSPNAKPKIQDTKSPLQKEWNGRKTCCFGGFVIVVVYAFHWISHHVPKRPKKKIARVPLGGPSPCGKTGLTPCRQCTFCFLGCFSFFLICFFLQISKSKPQNPRSKNQNSKIQTPKSKIQKSKLQNPNPKIQNPKSKLTSSFGSWPVPPKKWTNIFLQIHGHSEQNIKVTKWNSPKKLRSSAHKRLFLENLEQTPKMRWKKIARVLFAGEGVGGGCTYHK